MAAQGRSTTSQLHPTSPTNYDQANSHNAALKGATLAFQHQKTGDLDKPKAPAPTTPNPTSRRDGALRAATQASREHSVSRPRSPPDDGARNTVQRRRISRQATGESLHDTKPYSKGVESGAVAQRLSQVLSSSATRSYLSPGPDSKSTSFIAATLAASRSASPSPNHTGQASPYNQAAVERLTSRVNRRRSYDAKNFSSSTTSLDMPDTSPIPPTTSLISMFETKGDTDPVKKRDLSPEQKNVAKAKLQLPPPPPREASGLSNSAAAPSAPRPPTKPKPATVQLQPISPPGPRREVLDAVSHRPEPLKQRLDVQPPAGAPGLPSSVGKAASQLGLPAEGNVPNSNNNLRLSKAEPRSQKGPPGHATSPRSTSSDDSFVSASSTQSARPSFPARGRERPQQDNTPWLSKSRPSPPKSTVSRRSSSLRADRPMHALSRTPTTTEADATRTLPLESLTSAIMAGSLAAARHPPTAPTASHGAPAPALPAPRRSGHHRGGGLLQPHHTGDGDKSRSRSRRRNGSASPQRGPGGMLTTLRQPVTSLSDDDDRHRKRGKKIGGRKKHAHHEGSRKRWRDEISLRERRRYEAVWASNCGLFVEEPEDVVNVIVRDIWSRSRLPFDELAEVWDLVWREGMALGKQEFVVGLWLIDQRLKGKRLPARVSDSVWDSARGMKVMRPKVK